MESYNHVQTKFRFISQFLSKSDKLEHKLLIFLMYNYRYLDKAHKNTPVKSKPCNDQILIGCLTRNFSRDFKHINKNLKVILKDFSPNT